MDRLTSMLAFVKAIELGSFTAASLELKITAQMVGKHIRDLEQWLGTKLFYKTTRQQSLTEVGLLFYERCKLILNEVDITESLTQDLLSKPKGKLKIVAPLSFGQYQLMPLLIRFLDKHPDVEVDLLLTNQLINIIDEGFDVAIRALPLGSEQLVAKRLMTQELLVCASPSYVKKQGVPIHPLELGSHQCLTGNFGGVETWRFVDGESEVNVRVDGRLHINSWPALLEAAKQGAGIILHPRNIVDTFIKNGTLLELLTDYPVQPVDICLFFAQARKVTPKLRAFADFMQSEFASRTLN